MLFTFEEDKKFFKDLLCSEGEELEIYSYLFDFRSPKIKRDEFNRIQPQVLENLILHYGKICMLKYPDKCDITSGLQVDHLIPLSSNKLNKELRKIGTSRDNGVLRKTPTLSYGSNDLRNLIISCRECNQFKKVKFLKKEDIKKILSNLRPFKNNIF